MITGLRGRAVDKGVPIVISWSWVASAGLRYALVITSVPMIDSVIFSVVVALAGPASETVIWPTPDATAIVLDVDATSDVDTDWMIRV